MERHFHNQSHTLSHGVVGIRYIHKHNGPEADQVDLPRSDSPHNGSDLSQSTYSSDKANVEEPSVEEFSRCANESSCTTDRNGAHYSSGAIVKCRLFEPMAFCITGASGFLGRHLLAALLERDETVRVLTHRIRPGAFNGVTEVHGDLLDEGSLETLVDEGDTVVHLAYLRAEDHVNVTAARNLARTCARRRVRRMVHLSTAMVVGAAEADTVTEETPCQPIAEYERMKLRIESLILQQLERRCDTVVLRPTAIFGPGGTNLLKMTDELVKDGRLVNYLRACLYGNRRLNLVCVQNVVQAIIHLSSLPIESGTVFLVSDDDAAENNYRSVADLICSEIPCKRSALPNVAFLSGLLPLLLQIKGRSSTNPNRVFSSGKLIATGFTRRLSFEAGVRQFVEWYRTRNQNGGY